MRPGTREDQVEAGWQAVRDDGRVNTELLDLAYAEPLLRWLFPWTGMGELHFSRCTKGRWTWDIPYISGVQPNGGYWVLGPSRNEWVGRVDTAEQAVALVVERLPPGCGPAFTGTPDELTAHERAVADRQVAEAVAAERESLSIGCRADPARLKRLLAPDFHEYGASGSELGYEGTAEQVAESTGLDAGPITVENMRGLLLADGLVMVKYTSQSNGRRAHRTSLWRRVEPGRWQIFHHQGTITNL